MMGSLIAEQDTEMAQTLFEQAIELWANPEIERRRNAGVLQEGFELRALQVVFSIENPPKNTTRLNDEVRAVARYRLEDPVEQGQEITIRADRVQSLALPQDDDPNAAHLTMVGIDGHWIISFDFRYNRARAKEHLSVSRDFLDMARLAIEREKTHPACELLFGALELAVKAELLLTPSGESKRHKEWLKRFSAWTRLGNAPSEVQSVLAKLTGLRPGARYLERSIAIGPEILTQYADTVEQQITHVQARLDSAFSADDGEEN